MKKLIVFLLLFILIIFGLNKVKDYYQEKEIINSNPIEEKQEKESEIDKISVNNIINNINTNIATKVMTEPSYKVPSIITDMSLISVRGDKPTSINLEIKNMQVYKGDIVYKGITYHYENEEITVKE